MRIRDLLRKGSFFGMMGGNRLKIIEFLGYGLNCVLIGLNILFYFVNLNVVIILEGGCK